MFHGNPVAILVGESAITAHHAKRLINTAKSYRAKQAAYEYQKPIDIKQLLTLDHALATHREGLFVITLTTETIFDCLILSCHNNGRKDVSIFIWHQGPTRVEGMRYYLNVGENTQYVESTIDEAMIKTHRGNFARS